MDLRNRWGTAVDAVPFLVVAATAFTVCYSFGPVYVLTFDFGIHVALGASTVAFVVLTVVAYYRLVWSFRPEYREEVPVGVRFRRLVITAFVGVAVLVLLALPFFLR